MRLQINNLEIGGISATLGVRRLKAWRERAGLKPCENTHSHSDTPVAECRIVPLSYRNIDLRVIVPVQAKTGWDNSDNGASLAVQDHRLPQNVRGAAESPASQSFSDHHHRAPPARSSSIEIVRRLPAGVVRSRASRLRCPAKSKPGKSWCGKTILDVLSAIRK